MAVKGFIMGDTGTLAREQSQTGGPRWRVRDQGYYSVPVLLTDNLKEALSITQDGVNRIIDRFENGAWSNSFQGSDIETLYDLAYTGSFA